MSIEKVKEIIARLGTPAGALAVLGAAVDARASGASLDPSLEPHVNDVLDGIGARALLDALTPEELGVVLAEIRAFAHMNAALPYAEGRSGWAHTDPKLLDAVGSNVHNLPMMLRKVIAPSLDGLASRLDANDAAFLDVGTGVARLSIAVAREFPKMRVVGIDPWAPSLRLARENVASAGLGHRIELREQAGEAIDDRAAFDIAWVAAPFIPKRVMTALAQRVRAALKPGGWVLFAIAKPSPDPLAAAIMRARIATWGGAQWTTDEVEGFFTAAGYPMVKTLPSPPHALAAMIAARA